jgi:hypothetical protein
VHCSPSLCSCCPPQAFAGVKDEVAALAPPGLVPVLDAEGNELVARNTDEPYVPASGTEIVTAWLAMGPWRWLPLRDPLLPGPTSGCSTCVEAAILS